MRCCLPDASTSTPTGGGCMSEHPDATRHRRAPDLAADAGLPTTTGPAWDWQWEDYLYPAELTGGQDVLRNILDLHDPEQWLRAERILSAGRQLQLAADPSLIRRSFTAGHWRALHAHLFGDLYSWAGQFRSVDFAKFDGIDRLNPFAHADDLDTHAGELMTWIRDEAMFATRPRAGVLAGLTVFVQTANMIHPFREGNGRTLRVLAEHVADAAGYRLEWSRIPDDLEHAALVMTYRGQDRYLAEALDTALDPRTTRTALNNSPTSWHLRRQGADLLASASMDSPHDAAASILVRALQAPAVGLGD